MENIIFGVHPVKEAIEAGRQIEKIYIKKGIDPELWQEIFGLCKMNNIQLQAVPIEKLNRITRFNHQGIIAQVSPIEYKELPEILSAAESSGKTPLFVIIDQVTDVRNFGAIARSAECARVDGIIISLKNSAPVNAEAIKTSAGALNKIPVCRVGSLRNSIKFLQTNGIQIVAATEKSNAVLYDADFKKPTAIVLGAEDHGISNEILKICDAKVAIPMEGSINSLNVSAAAAITLFEVVRQRRV